MLRINDPDIGTDVATFVCKMTFILKDIFEPTNISQKSSFLKVYIVS